MREFSFSLSHIFTLYNRSGSVGTHEMIYWGTAQSVYHKYLFFDDDDEIDAHMVRAHFIDWLF